MQNRSKLHDLIHMLIEGGGDVRPDVEELLPDTVEVIYNSVVYHVTIKVIALHEPNPGSVPPISTPHTLN